MIFFEKFHGQGIIFENLTPGQGIIFGNLNPGQGAFCDLPAAPPRMFKEQIPLTETIINMLGVCYFLMQSNLQIHGQQIHCIGIS